jgi:ParB family chromosome partitioning protein
MTHEVIPLPHFTGALDAAISVDEVLRFKAEAAALKEYARHAIDPSLEAYATEWQMRAERKLGQLMAAQKAAGLMCDGGDAMRARVQTGPEVDKLITLAEAGIDKHLAQRAREAAALPEEEFEDRISEKRDAIVNRVHVSNNSGNNEWYTPPEFIETARKVMGSIDCDPASSAIANQTVKASEFLTAEDDGLSRPWRGNVWMNPPYAQPLVNDFANTLTEKFANGEINQACVLVNNATETGWFYRLVSGSAAICFVRSRIKFLDRDGVRSGAPLQGQAIIYFGPNAREFAAGFSEFGYVYPIGPI